MEENSNQNSEEEEKNENNGSFINENIQKSQIQELNDEYNYYDDTQILRDFLFNSNLYHKNLNKILDFGINKKNFGPYEIGIQFNAKFFINIIKDYYIKLDCERMNIIVYNKMIYIYSHVESILKIFTIFNTRYIGSEKVKIIEGHGNNIRANFDTLQLLKNIDLHTFNNNETIKIFFKIYKNKIRNKNKKPIEEINPFFELSFEKNKFDKEFNFEHEAIPGLLIGETVRGFDFTMNCNFAPEELSRPPIIPESIFTNFIINLSIDLINNTQRMNLNSPIEISCNKQICNFISNSYCENFFMFNDIEGAEIKEENFLNYFKLFDPLIENGILYKKMIGFTLSRTEIEALKILNKKTALIYLYADRKEKYYFTQEFDQDGNRTSYVILQSSNDRPKIKDIEDCCLYSDHWEDWMKYLSGILSRDSINELKELRKLKIKNNLVSDNKKKKKKNKNEENKIEKDDNNENINNNLINKKSVKNINVVDGKNEFEGISLYSNDRRGNESTFIMRENNSIYDIGRGKPNKNKNNIKENNEKSNENFVNPFKF